MARRVHPLHKMHCLWADRSACPCFIDLTPHKFTTSAFLVLRLTGQRFRGGMRSDRGREMEGERRNGRASQEGNEKTKKEVK